jgi:late competence protein required for DNA uptake (superfamily II DNA/RNA helicase)
MASSMPPRHFVCLLLLLLLQFSRMAVLDSFRSGQAHLLVATDVAARGLDIKSIKTVINYDAARDIDTHIHRCALLRIALRSCTCDHAHS